MTNGALNAACLSSFYRAEAGHEPVREWLQEFDPQDREAIGTDLLRVQEQCPSACWCAES
jgi:hypothetical protein